MNKKTICLRQLFLILGCGLLIFADQLTKHLAEKHLKGAEDIKLLGDVLVLRYAENEGAAFSILQGRQGVLAIFSLIIAAGIIFLYETVRYEKRLAPLRIAYIMLISGAIGNMIDRFRLKYVIDFIYVKIINFPVFNVADICVTCACGLLIILFIFVYKDDAPMHTFGKGKSLTEGDK